ncbi:MAG TPA: NADH-quinone oxidoreductase subunit E [Pararhizobium sp.]|nr:NADH-quinone oxidoreductase subunit E [Pararhizobium sp.]
MSVRRLAEDHVQPAGFEFTPENAAWANATIRKYPEGRQQSAVIPLLMRAQEQEGWVTKAALERVADMLGMPYIRLLEVATFYTQFQLKPVGTRAHVQVCGTTPCMLRGSEQLMDVCRRKINPEQFDTNDAGTLSWEEVECQGACVNAPMVMIFKDTYEDLTPERLEEIIDLFEAGHGAEVPAGPQIDRIYSAPVGGPTTLNSPGGQPTKAAAGKSSGGTHVPPSKASRPVTSAPETDPTIDSPSPEKAAAADEEVNSDGEAERQAEKAGRTSDSVSGSAASSTTAAAGVGKARSKATGGAAGTAKPSEPQATGGRPPALDQPDQPDDLQMIAGVGAKLEARLHEIGIWTWKQIGNWSEAEQEWVDAELKLRGRVAREDWVRQAKALARGGEAEYVKEFGKLPR